MKFLIAAALLVSCGYSETEIHTKKKVDNCRLCCYVCEGICEEINYYYVDKYGNKVYIDDYGQTVGVCYQKRRSRYNGK